MKKLNINPKDYKKFFTAECEITCWHSEFLMCGSLGKGDLFLTSKDKSYDVFINKDREKICLKEGVKLFSDQKRYDKYIKEFRDYVNYANKHIIPKYSNIPEKLTKKEFLQLNKMIGKLWYYYGITEFPYLDLAYKEMKRRKDKAMEKNLNEISRFKFKGREVLNAYFFKNGPIDNILTYISRKYLQDDDARYLYSNDLIKVFDGKKPKKSLIMERKKCYSAAIINGKIIKFSYKKSLRLNRLFTHFDKTDVIKGEIANPGVARGKAVIIPMLNSHEEIEKINRIMEKGDILVAETTSPDVLVLCHKAAAIVAEQGGLLSHAAVVSRELGLPCIIQAEKATKLLKTGDYIEVNADTGTIRKIKRII